MSVDFTIHFQANLQIIGMNPFVFIPPHQLAVIFNQIKRNKGVIKVLICVNGGEIFPQTLLKYKGDWRLYINTKILPNSPSRIGELLDIKLNLDFEDREIKMPIDLKGGLEKNPKAKEIFDNISPSLQKEIKRYISNLKTPLSIERNVNKAIEFLLGNGSFIGRKSISKK